MRKKPGPVRGLMSKPFSRAINVTLRIGENADEKY